MLLERHNDVKCHSTPSLGHFFRNVLSLFLKPGYKQTWIKKKKNSQKDFHSLIMSRWMRKLALLKKNRCIKRMVIISDSRLDKTYFVSL